MQADDPTPVSPKSEDEVFEFGDQTIFRMWQQPFDPAGAAIDPEETMMLRPPKALRAVEPEPEPPKIRSESPSMEPPPAVSPAAESELDEGDEFGTMVVRAHPHSGHLHGEDRLARLAAKVDALSLALDDLRKELDAIRSADLQIRSARTSDSDGSEPR